MKARANGGRGMRPRSWVLCAAIVLAAAVAAAPVGASAALRVPSVPATGFVPLAIEGTRVPAIAAAGIDPAPPLVVVEPRFADSWHGWRRTPTTVRVVAPGWSVLYRWDSDLGEWQTARGSIVVPEGRHVLHLAAVPTANGGFDAVRATWRQDVALKVSLSSPKIAGSAARPGTAVISPQALRDSDTVTLRVTVTPQAGPTMHRLGGRDRYATAALVSQATFTSADTVILATGENFADALASSGLAGSHGAPLLLTKRAALPSATLAEMRRLGAKTCIITGSTAAVSAAVASSVKNAGLSVRRIGGADRYATAAMIADELDKREGRRTLAFVARGDNYPDALAVSPFAFNARAPILLVRPTSMPAATRTYVSRGYLATVVVAGSSAAVSNAIEAELRGYVGSVSRAGGRDRYETAVLAARAGRALGLTDYSMVGIATGQNFPDALCGGVAVGKQRGSVLLVKRDSMPSVTARAISDYGPYLRHVEIYGSSAAVSAGVEDSIRVLMR